MMMNFSDVRLFRTSIIYVVSVTWQCKKSRYKPKWHRWQRQRFVGDLQEASFKDILGTHNLFLFHFKERA